MSVETRVHPPERPRPAETGPPSGKRSPREWARENLFSSWFNGALTVAFAALLAWLAYRVATFVFVTGRWEIVDRNLTNLLIFQFPREELWRVWTALFVLAGALGLGAGAAARLRDQAVAEGRAEPVSGRMVLRRAGPLLLVVAVLLWFAGTVTAVALTAGVALTFVALRFAGHRVPPQRVRWAALAVALGLVAALAVLVAFGGPGYNRFGGLMLTVFLAVAGIAISFPIGVLLALGRRSSFLAVRMVCVGYIELFRGVPLITVLFMSAVMLGFFLPVGWDRPQLVTRALVALVLFTSAYVAEVVRGGLQSVPRGQIEAAQALGLSPIRVTALVVLPQALRNVIPAMVGQFISLFKDTSLVAVIGLTELLGVAELITEQPDFIAQGLVVETLVFAAFVYWAGSYWMSRESQRLEARLGVGQR